MLIITHITKLKCGYQITNMKKAYLCICGFIDSVSGCHIKTGTIVSKSLYHQFRYMFRKAFEETEVHDNQVIVNDLSVL